MNKLVLIMAPEDRAALERAHGYLEYPSLAARLSSALGAPIEQGLRMLPKSWHHAMQRKAERIFRNMLEVSIASLGENPKPVAKERLHKVLACGAGAVGGFFGLPALLVELPVTTSLMLRSIADVAHANGEDLRALETRLACLEVFALGGRAQSDDAAETGYYGLRVALAVQFSDVAARLAERGLPVSSASGIVHTIASRFGFVVSEKAAAQMVPYLGALSGAAINGIFMQHFQDTAKGHFTMRRLERKYSPALIKAEYHKLSLARGAKSAAQG